MSGLHAELGKHVGLSIKRKEKPYTLEPSKSHHHSMQNKTPKVQSALVRSEQASPTMAIAKLKVITQETEKKNVSHGQEEKGSGKNTFKVTQIYDK